MATATAAASPAAMMTPQKSEESPLYFKIGGAEFYPLGFMDVTNFFRTTNVGNVPRLDPADLRSVLAGRDEE